MKKLTAAAALAALAFGGCAADSETDSNSKAAKDSQGMVETALSIPGGYNIASVAYTVENAANAVVDSGSVSVDHSNKILFQVGNLPIATNYEMILTATAVSTVGEENVGCEGHANFDIGNNGVTGLTMTMTCQGNPTTDADNAGDIRTTVNVSQDGAYACPVPTGISALPASVDVGFVIQLKGFVSSAADSVAWTGVGGTFGAPTALSTGFTCGTPGSYELTLTATKARCADTTLQVEVECTGVVTSEVSCTDALDNDGDGLVDCADTADCGTNAACLPPETACADGIDNNLNGATDCADTNCASDPACVVADPCVTCLKTSCTDPSLNLTAVCFDGHANDVFGGANTPAQPLFSQLCTDAVECSAAASTNCFLDSIGPSQCYCGEISIGECAATGPAASAPCKGEWERATRCDGIADAAARNSCVSGAFQDLTLPAGFAFFLSSCAVDSCSAVCTN